MKYRADVDLIARVRVRLNLYARSDADALDQLERMSYDEMRARGEMRDGEEPVKVFDVYLIDYRPEELNGQADDLPRGLSGVRCLDLEG